jgi:hypothetical protein
MSWSLYDARGRRKYLVPKERWAFLDAWAHFAPCLPSLGLAFPRF